VPTTTSDAPAILVSIRDASLVTRYAFVRQMYSSSFNVQIYDVVTALYYPMRWSFVMMCVK
jgi:hypothetical protein